VIDLEPDFDDLEPTLAPESVGSLPPNHSHVIDELLGRTARRTGDLTDAEALLYADILAHAAGPEHLYLSSVQLARALVRLSQRLDRVTWRPEQRETVRRFVEVEGERCPITARTLADLLVGQEGS
jgi:hypothetical protein